MPRVADEMNPKIPDATREGAPRLELSGEQAEIMTAILRVLREGERFVVCSHSRPDGDAVGSMLAMGMLLEQLGKRVDLVTADRIPNVYRGLPGAQLIRTVMRVHGPYDAAILLECDGVERTRLRGLEDLFLINIDHHVTAQQFAALNWVDHRAVSVGAMVYQLALLAGAKISPEMAACLYTTLLTDTGAFCYGAVNESTFALARELVHAGADPLAIAHEVYFSAPAAKLLLLGAALRRLKREGRMAWLWVTQQDMLMSCAAEEDCEGFVNLALGIAGVEIAVFSRELPEGLIRMSLRSRGKVNVAEVAAKLGGGGHENAAGCTLDGPMQRALDEILMELQNAETEVRAASR
jgi:phosphoesterase RecJ-like protein